MQGGAGFRDELSERGIEFHRRPSPVFTVKKVAAGDCYAEHFFEAHRLGAELDLIGVVRFRLAALVFHRHHRAVFMKFHDVALPGNPQLQRAHRHAAGDSHPGLRFVLSLVGLVVQHLALGGKFVFRPDLLQMDEDTLARAIQPMLERGNRQELVFGEH